MTEETTALATTPGYQPAVYNEPFDDGLGEMGSGDTIIPRLNITQSQTPDLPDGMEGKFCINVTGDYNDEMDVVVIKLSKSRILFPDKYKRDNAPLCRSHDFITPADDIKDAKPMCHTCELMPQTAEDIAAKRKPVHHCVYANWGSYGAPPRCNEVWNLLIVDIATYMPMWFSLKSSALKPAKKILSAIKMIAKAKRIPACVLSIKMQTEKTTNDSGTYFIPKFSHPLLLDEENAKNMALIRAELDGVNIKDSNEPLEDIPPFPGGQAEEEF